MSQTQPGFASAMVSRGIWESPFKQTGLASFFGGRTYVWRSWLWSQQNRGAVGRMCKHKLKPRRYPGRPARERFKPKGQTRGESSSGRLISVNRYMCCRASSLLGAQNGS